MYYCKNKDKASLHNERMFIIFNNKVFNCISNELANMFLAKYGSMVQVDYVLKVNRRKMTHLKTCKMEQYLVCSNFYLMYMFI